MKDISGIFPALVTPFTKNDKISEKALRSIVKKNIAEGVSGFYVGGSTGEAFMLSLDERKEILEIVKDEANDECIIIAHIGNIGTGHAIELAKHARIVGADVISSIPPFYYKFSFEEIKQYYFDIIAETGMPMIVYNFPALSGVELTADRVNALYANPKVIGIKHTSQNLFQVERMKNENKNLIVLNGHDEVFLAGLNMGADGAIGSTFNFMAEKFVKIHKLFNENRIKEAQIVQKEANDIISTIIPIGVNQSIKYLLSLDGIECGVCRRPFREITDEEKIILKGVKI